MSKTSNIFKCPHCDYSTPRKYNLTLHLNKKNPCKPKENESTLHASDIFVNNCQHAIRKCHENVNISESGSVDDVDSVNNVVIAEKNSKKKFTCEKCGKGFASRQSKSFHKKNCSAVAPLESNLKTENERLQEENKKLQTALTEKTINSNQVINIYNDNSTNTTTTNSSTTNNVNILNNFDSPSLNHITARMIGELYLKSDRELPRMIGQAVRKIYKVPENDCIRIKYGNQAGFAEVKQDDETRILPVSDVLETVLSQTTTLCGKELMKCCGDDIGQIPGPNVIHHANELAVLHWGFVPETQAARQGFFKFVKSALL